MSLYEILQPLNLQELGELAYHMEHAAQCVWSEYVSSQCDMWEELKLSAVIAEQVMYSK